MRNLEKNRRSATPNKPIEQTKKSRYIYYLQERAMRDEISLATHNYGRVEEIINKK